jgi:hypothetical protein
MAKFPNPCSRCGMCCLSIRCPVAIAIHGRGDGCPELSFEGDVATCHVIETMGIGAGCCIKARAFARGQQFDFAELPPKLKVVAVRQIRQIRTKGEQQT